MFYIFNFHFINRQVVFYVVIANHALILLQLYGERKAIESLHQTQFFNPYIIPTTHFHRL